MLFNSFEFLILFLPITVLGYYLLRKVKQDSASLLWLALSSLFFYGYWKVAYLPLMLISIGFNYLIGKYLTGTYKSAVNKKFYLISGVIFNIGLLAYFKYTNFFIENLNQVFGLDISSQNIVLPLAISFFTFQQLAFLIDSYKGKLASFSLNNYVLFVTFFPQLIAGPIVHHSEMMPQFAKVFKEVDFKKTSKGLYILAIGLFKKVMIADNLSPYVSKGFDVSEQLNFIDGWLTSFAYSFQLYFDFSGYTDMAWGAALILGIQLPQNFNSPYKATSIKDFWRRWHMTLSRFLRDYLYIPLGGNQKGFSRTLINLFLTFLIGGIWHGAAWTFVAWGAMHGLALVIERLMEKAGVKLNKWLTLPLTFMFVNLAWVFFRALSFNDAWKVISSMFSFEFSGAEIFKWNENLLWLLVAFLVAFFGKNSNEYIEKFKPNLLNFAIAFVFIIISVLHVNQLSEFIYFQF